MKPFGRILLAVRLAIIALAAGMTCHVSAATVTLYDGNGLPAAQPWLLFGFDGAGFTQTAVASGTQLQTTQGVSAGYSNYVPILNTFKNAAFPALHRSSGFELSFTAQVNSEAHANNDRAGFSVILLGADQKGVEVGFWENEIWAQLDSPLFTHGSGASIDTTQRRDYRLRILGDDYTLLEGNNTLLNGTVQDYSAFGVPYSLPSYLFIGDDTSSAGADVVLGPIRLNSDLSAVPEPSLSAFLLAGCLLAARMRHCRRCSPRR